jgi:hypothetical protein
VGGVLGFGGGLGFHLGIRQPDILQPLGVPRHRTVFAGLVSHLTRPCPVRAKASSVLGFKAI